jgi:[CysO sulfur-carrier protein]-S-L-cysteine hydrolase
MHLAINIPRSIFDDIISQAYDERPCECCGLLGGRSWQVFSRYPLANKSPEPTKRYFAAPEDLFEAMRRMRSEGEDLVAIYHSHPRGPAYPSPTDIELAFYQEAVYLIIGLEPQVEMRAFTINGQEVTEIQILSQDASFESDFVNEEQSETKAEES